MIAVMLGIVALGYSGDINEKILTCSFTTNVTAQLQTTDSTMNGFIEQIIIDVPVAATTTNIVTITAIDKAGATTVLATNSLTGDMTYRPIIQRTNNGGATNANVTSFLLLGETLTMTVTNITGAQSQSNVSFRAIIKTSK